MTSCLQKLCPCCSCEAGVVSSTRRGSERIEFKEANLYNLPWKSVEEISKLQPSTEVMHALYRCLAFTAYNYVGQPQGAYSVASPELLEYCNALSAKIPSNVRTQLEEDARAMKPPDMHLRVELIRAGRLRAADPNGLRDPYCKLWLNPNHVQISQTVPKNLNPTWNKEFLFKISDTKKEVFHLEVWDEDPESIRAALAEIRGIAGFRGFISFLRDIGLHLCRGGRNVDDFLGRFKMPLSSIPVDGLHGNFELLSRANKKDCGFITLHLSLLVNIKNSFPVFLRHIYVSKLCLSFSANESSNNFSEGSKWCDIVPKVPLTLLKQHAIQGNIDELQHHLGSWIATIQVSAEKNRRFHFDLLYNLLKSVQDTIDTNQYQMERPTETAFLNSLDIFMEYCLATLRKFTTIFHLEKGSNCSEFQNIFYCLLLKNAIYEHDEMITKVELVLREEITARYRDAFPVLTYQKVTREVDTEEVKRQIAAITEDLRDKDALIANLWHIPYTAIVYVEVDLILQEKVKSFIKMLCLKFEDAEEDEDIQKAISTNLRIYNSLNHLKEYILSKLTEGSEVIDFEFLPKWIGNDSMLGWFKWLKDKSLTWIDNAVDVDKFERMDDRKYCSSSAMDSIHTIQAQIIPVWKCLKWPGTDCTLAMANAVSNICKYYAKLIEKEIIGFWDVDEFNISTQFCVAICDLHEIGNYVKKLREEVSKEEKGLRFGNHPLKVLLDTERFVEMVLRTQCAKKVNVIKKHMGTLIKPVVKADNQNIENNSITAFSVGIQEYLTFAYQNMENRVFAIFLQNMWDAILYTLMHELDTFHKTFSPCLRNKPRVYTSLNIVLEHMHSVFHSGGDGLADASLKKGIYVDIKKIIVEHITE